MQYRLELDASWWNGIVSLAVIEVRLRGMPISWNAEALFRSFPQRLTWFRSGIVAWVTLKSGSRPRRIVRKLLAQTILWIRLRPRVANYATKVVQRFPRLERRLRAIQTAYYANASEESSRSIRTAPHHIWLSPRGSAIFNDIKKSKR